MYEYIKGDIVDFGSDYLVVENNGIGYHINASQNTIAEFIENKEEVKIYTKLIVKEDDMSLCGFSSYDELKLFNLLVTVSGIGVKVALGMLSSFHYINLIEIIRSGDYITLTKAQGIGKKTAERTVLELKDKMEKQFLGFEKSEIKLVNEFSSNAMEDAINALVSLGYKTTDIKKSLSTYAGDINNVEEIIKFGLIGLSSL